MTHTITHHDLEVIFKEWQAEREQMFALTMAIEILLAPKDGRDSPHYNAWRLCNIAQETLGCTRHFNLMKQIAFGEAA